jgi:hypothetical protein
MLEGMLGKIYTTVVLARLVSLEIAQRTGDRSPSAANPRP